MKEKAKRVREVKKDEGARMEQGLMIDWTEIGQRIHKTKLKSGPGVVCLVRVQCYVTKL